MTITQNDLQKAEKNILDRLWRLNNLYYIIDKKGQKVKFSMNWAQLQLYDDLHYCNIILKARQLGITTFITILFLDVALFNSNISCGIISDTEENAKYIFRKIKFAYDSLPEELKMIREAKIDSAKELTFSNNSLIRVGTSLRSATFQYLLISEYGKIAVDDIKRANEILTGSLNTIALGSYCFIESTARGRSGIFYDMCKEAKKNQDIEKQLTKMDYKFHFLPWWKDPNYRIRQGGIAISEDLQEYFSLLNLKNVDLDHEQKCWYAAKLSTQGDNMRREFPSTPEECWEVSNEGFYYGKHLTVSRLEKRICHVPYDENLPVYTAWDLGYNDQTSIWFVQYYGKEIRLIDYVEGSGESLAHWLGVVKSKPYVYEKHLAPHDVMVHEFTSGMTRQASARKMGVNLIAVQKVEIIPGIDQVRSIFPRCFFDEKKCEKGIYCLENYKKEWNERDGCWNSSPCHNWASHGCFTADTLILTRNGTHPIMSIQKDEEVLTLEGWVKCNKATINRKNANIVRVSFQDGTIVKCTPDHLFLTEKGWISAKHLEKGFVIQSSLMKSPHILEEVCIESGQRKDISKKEDLTFTEMFGGKLLVKYLLDVISTIKTTISRTISYIIWNAFPLRFISNSNNQTLKGFLSLQEKKQENGINQMKVKSGIEDKQSDPSHGLNGNEKRETVNFVKKNLIVSSEKMEYPKNFARTHVKLLIIEKVESLQATEDVYCINVPDVHHFSLSNGAVVHNSDAFRVLATGIHHLEKREGSGHTSAHNPNEWLRDKYSVTRRM